MWPNPENLMENFIFCAVFGLGAVLKDLRRNLKITAFGHYIFEFNYDYTIT